MNEKMELLRQLLHEAIESGDSDEILRASVALDVVIVEEMNKFICRRKRRKAS